MRLALVLLSVAACLSTTSATFYYQIDCDGDMINHWAYLPWATVADDRSITFEYSIKNYAGWNGNIFSDPSCEPYSNAYVISHWPGNYPRLNYITIQYHTSADTCFYTNGWNPSCSGSTYAGTNSCTGNPSDQYYCHVTFGNTSTGASSGDHALASNYLYNSGATTVYSGAAYAYSGNILDCDYLHSGEWSSWGKRYNYSGRPVSGMVIADPTASDCSGEGLDPEGETTGTLSCSRTAEEAEEEEEWEELDTETNWNNMFGDVAERGWNDAGASDPFFAGSGGARDT